jgi:uncharacterized protein YggE
MLPPSLPRKILFSGDRSMKKLLIILFLLVSFPAYAAEEEHSININGIGEVEVAVDNVMISAGINTRSKSLTEAKNENQKKYDSLLNVLKKSGLEKSAIKSNFVSINPVYVTCYPTPQNPQPQCDTAKLDYYAVTRSIEIKLEDLTKYDALISGLSESGASNVNTGQYGVANISKYRDQARDMAIDVARGKAEKVAKKLEVKLGKPLHFDSYDGSAESPPIPMMARASAKFAMDSAPATDVQTMGKIKVTVNVNIAYGIE